MSMSPLFAVADLSKMAAETGETFGVDAHHFVAQVISFIIVAALLQRFAYKPLLKALDDRRARIAASLQEADQIRAELARTEAERTRILADVNRQADRLLEEARQAADRLLVAQNQKAAAAAEQILTQARESIARERNQMLTELKTEVGTLVVKTVAEVTGKILTPDDHRRLVEESLRQLA